MYNNKTFRIICMAQVQRLEHHQHVCLEAVSKKWIFNNKSDEKAQINEQIHQQPLVKL